MPRATVALREGNQPPVQAGILQRACACGRHNVSSSGCSDCENKKQSLMRRATNDRALDFPPSIVYDVLRTPGEPLNSETRAAMEPRLGRVSNVVPTVSGISPRLRIGDSQDASESEAEAVAERITKGHHHSEGPRYDLSGVRVHSDEAAAQSAEAVNALAYTVGRHIVFNRGQYQPHTTAGSSLLAHELTHVIQQSDVSRTAMPTSSSALSGAGVLARQPKPAPDPGWSDAQKGGQNEFVVTVDEKGNIIQGKAASKGVWRVPLQGFTHGLQKGSKGPAIESSEDRAIALIPNTVTPTKSQSGAVQVDVLFHLHGFGVGYRELQPGEQDFAGVLKPGEVRDIALYEMEQQLLRHVATTKRPIIAILPQGTVRSAFGDLSSNSDAYINEVFNKLIPKFLPAGATPGRITVSGHSGAGPTVMSIANKATKRTDVLLFDSINFSCTDKETVKIDGKDVEKCKKDSPCSSNEVDTVKKFVRKKISDEVKSLVGIAEDKMPDEIKAKGTRFRGFTSASLKTKDTCSYGHWYNLLQQDIENAIKGSKVPEKVKDEFRKNYVVQQVAGPHERVIGQGNLEAALKD